MDSKNNHALIREDAVLIHKYVMGKCIGFGMVEIVYNELLCKASCGPEWVCQLRGNNLPIGHAYYPISLLARNLGMTTSKVARYLTRLEKSGLIEILADEITADPIIKIIDYTVTEDFLAYEDKDAPFFNLFVILDEMREMESSLAKKEKTFPATENKNSAGDFVGES